MQRQELGLERDEDLGRRAEGIEVRTLSDGGQSMKTKSNGSVSASSWSRRMTSRPTVPSISSSAPARSIWLPQIDRFGRPSRRTLASGSLLVKTS